MSSKLAFFAGLLSASLTVAGLGYVLVRLEQTSPFAQRPSIALRVWTGDLPTADLPRVLAETTAQVEAVKAATAKTEVTIRAHQDAGRAMSLYLQQLEAHITEKQAGQWSAPPK